MSLFLHRQPEVCIFISDLTASLEFGGYVNVKALTDFVDWGGNVLVAGSPEVGEAVKDFASECGIEFDDSNSYVIDHNNYDEMDYGEVNPKSSIFTISPSAYSRYCKPRRRN